MTSLDIWLPYLYVGNYENIQLTFTAFNNWVTIDHVEIDLWRSL